MFARASVLSVACFAVFLAKPYGIHAQPWGPVWGDAGGRTIQVGAVGEVVTEPDFAILDLGIDSRGAQLREARSDNDKRAQAVLKAIRGFRVEPKDVQTSQVHVAIEVEHDREGKASDIYVYRKGFRVVVRDFKNLEAVLNGLLDAGINRVNRVEFDTTRRPALETEAREKAIKAVGAKAQALARSFGQTLGQPLLISVDESPDAFRGGLGGMLPEHDPTIAGGQLYIRVSVSVTYGLVDEKRDSKAK
jgi:uncharacterized protein YggE